jgi:hypothetical protein
VRRKIYIAYALLLLVGIQLQGQEAEGLTQLRAYYKSLQDTSVLNGKNLRLSYLITTQGRQDNKQEKVESEVKVQVNKLQSIVETSTSVAYKDAYAQVQVQHDIKRIVIGESNMKQVGAFTRNQFFQQQLDLLNSFQQKFYKPGSWRGKAVQLIQLESSPEIRKRTGVAQINYIMSENAGEVYQFELIYENHPVLDKLKMEFKEFEYTAFKPLYSGSCLQFIYVDEETPREEYRDYQIIDTRKRK